MSWGRIDDVLNGHPKIMRAWGAHPRALGLELLAMSYCAAYETDGLVGEDFVVSKLPNRRERDTVVSALVDAGLWERQESGLWLHDYLDYNPSRAELDAKRARERSRKRSLNVRAGQEKLGFDDTKTPDSPGNSDVFRAEPRAGAPARARGRSPALPSPTHSPSQRTPSRRRRAASPPPPPPPPLPPCPLDELPTGDREQLQASWLETLASLREQVTEAAYSIYLEPLHPHPGDGPTAVLAAEPRSVSWIEDRFLGLLESALPNGLVVVSCNGPHQVASA